jgi:indole-3-glycerol phosphate synthase
VTIASKYVEGGRGRDFGTDGGRFLRWIARASSSRSHGDRPSLLRKDFVFDEYQLHEAIDAGADAILLIAAMLEDAQLNDLLQAAHALRLEALIEIHDLAEAERVLRFDVRLLGVNNRNLRTFVTDIQTSVELAPSLPDSTILVSESGIRTRADIERLRGAGYDAFLVGEELMRSGDERAALHSLVS